MAIQPSNSVIVHNFLFRFVENFVLQTIVDLNLLVFGRNGIVRNLATARQRYLIVLTVKEQNWQFDSFKIFPNRKEQKEKKLKSTQGQAEILANTLIGLDDSSSDYVEDESSDEEVPASAISGFAAIEQLSQRLKGSTVELKSLRKELVESEKTRESLIHELVETRHAHDKLPFFEQKVKDLTDECRENELKMFMW